MTGIYDVHCHIVPEVDDGADSLETAIRLLQMEYDDGVRTIYVTPHYRRGMFETSMPRIQKQYELLKEEAAKAGVGIHMYLGCEFHANMDMVDILDEKKRPTMGGSRCILTEFSERSEFSYIKERCYTLLSCGYNPIIAHAERYPALYKKLAALEELVDMGVYIQMNAGSILGAEGFGMKHFCKKVMKSGMLHFVGSDAHNTKDRKPMMGKCAEYMEKVMGVEYARNILIENPQKIIEEGR